MPAERSTIGHVCEVLRLKFVGGIPTREIACRIGVATSTVRATLVLRRQPELAAAREAMTDQALEAALLAHAGTKQGHRRQVERNWPSRAQAQARHAIDLLG
jgi:hypothetical protein